MSDKTISEQLRAIARSAQLSNQLSRKALRTAEYDLTKYENAGDDNAIVLQAIINKLKIVYAQVQNRTTLINPTVWKPFCHVCIQLTKRLKEMTESK